MSARRERPDAIYCDNGTNFREALHELKKYIQDLDTAANESNISAKGYQSRLIPQSSYFTTDLVLFRQYWRPFSTELNNS